MEPTATTLYHGGEALLLDPLGVAYLPTHAMLIVADLHLEKGSAFARRGTLLPPYDTIRTLRRLSWAIERYRPQRVVSLGDAFHDRGGFAALSADDRRQLGALQSGRDWIWVRGNHDPDPPPALTGDIEDELMVGRLKLAHLPAQGASRGSLVAGHLHPKARLMQGARKVTRACFAGDGECLILPAFGAYTGGLNVLADAIAGLFAAGFTAYLLGDAKVFAVAHRHLTPDPPDWRRHRLPAR